MEEICTATIKLTEHEINKLIWCIKSIHNVLNVFEITPDQDWIITLDAILKDMERISDDIKEKKEKRLMDQKINKESTKK